MKAPTPAWPGQLVVKPTVSENFRRGGGARMRGARKPGFFKSIPAEYEEEPEGTRANRDLNVPATRRKPFQALYGFIIPEDIK